MQLWLYISVSAVPETFTEPACFRYGKLRRCTAPIEKEEVLYMNEMMKLMTGRRTYRRFDQSRRIPKEVIEEIIESARLSSSARNGQ